MKMYSEQVKNYFNLDTYHGELRDVAVIHLQAENEKLQYQVELFVAIADHKISDAKFKAFGDPNMIACMSWLCEQLIGQSLETLKPLNAMEVGHAVNLHITKMYAATVVQALTHQLVEKIND